MIEIERKTLFDTIRREVAGGFSQDQVDNIEAIIMEIEILSIPKEHIAYILATAYHESRFRVVYETNARSADEAARRLARMYPGKRNKYWRRDPETGQRYLGRGFVQLTHKYNYEKAAKHLGIPELVTDPDLVMQPSIASQILVRGMEEGWFTGKKLSDYKSFYHMRRVVNGTDRASLIAGYAKKILPGVIIKEIDTGVPEKCPVPNTPVSDVNIFPNLTPQIIKVDGEEYELFIRKKKPEKSKMNDFDNYPDDVAENKPSTSGSPQIDRRGAETLTQKKNPFVSKTNLGIFGMLLFTIGPPVLTALGYPELAKALANHDWKNIIVTLFGMLGLYGRAVAVQPLKLPRFKFE